MSVHLVKFHMLSALAFTTLVSVQLGCSTANKDSESTAETPSQATAFEVKEEKKVEDYSQQMKDGITLELKNQKPDSTGKAALIEDSQSKSSDHTSVAQTASHHEAPKGTDPTIALGWLKNGNKRFTTGSLRNDGQRPSDRERLAKGQKPHTIVLSCSDSRVPPEIVFDQKLGEIFVVRTAGETLDPTSIASIEYALEHLGSRLILIMGHTACGAVKAAHSTLGGADAGSPNLNKLVADIHPRIRQFASLPPSADFRKETWANAQGVSLDLRSRSTIINEALHSGKVQIKTAVYNLDTGKVDFE